MQGNNTAQSPVKTISAQKIGAMRSRRGSQGPRLFFCGDAA
jgi:hypothetical protein